MSSIDPIDVFAEVARSLAEQGDVTQTLQRIGELAVKTVPGADYAAVTRIRAHGRLDSVAATDDVCRRVDEVQYETGEGPCVDAVREQEVVRIDDLAATERWPRFADRAVELGVAAMLSFRLFVEDDTSGALNLYARDAGSFDDESVRIGHVFAAHAAVAWDHAREVDGLAAAVATRSLIGQAQGILMAERRIRADEAFALLRGVSQERNRKLRDVAQDVVDTGALPEPAGR